MDEIKLINRKKWDVGILPSFLLFLLEAGVLLAAFVLSYLKKGQAGVWIGLFGIGLLISGICGIVISAKAVKRRSEPAGLVWLLCLLHVIQVLLVIGIYALGIMALL